MKIMAKDEKGRDVEIDHTALLYRIRKQVDSIVQQYEGFVEKLITDIEFLRKENLQLLDRSDKVPTQEKDEKN